MAYFVERLNLQVGDPIRWPQVEPDVVVDVIDKPTGHIVVAQKNGNIHAWWGSWGRDPQNPNRMRKGLAHHGGKYGWDDIQKPINQHNAVLERYLGHEVKVDEAREVPLKPRSLEEFVVAIRVRPNIVEVQGRKAWVGEVLEHIDRAMRGIVYPFLSPEDIEWRAQQLIIAQDKLQRSTNMNLLSAGRNLRQALGETGQRGLVAFQQTQDELFVGLHDMNDIIIRTFERAAHLERYRWVSENVVIEVHKKFAAAKADWDESSDDLQRSRIVEQLTGGLFGINLLRTLQVQPFRREVEELFAESRIDILSNLWISVNYPRISTALTGAEGKLFRWRGRIENRRLGAQQPPLPMPSETNPIL